MNLAQVEAYLREVCIDPTTPEGLAELRRINPKEADRWEAALSAAAKAIADDIDEQILKELRDELSAG